MKQNAKSAVIIFLILALFTGCGKAVRAEGTLTPKEAAENVMQAVKTLNMESFNEGTDNFIKNARRNFFGIPIEREYKVFNELQQTGFIKGKKYRFNRRLAETLMENLTWEIEEVKENGSNAEITMVITNKDISCAMGNYEIKLWKEMVYGSKTGIMQMLRELTHIADYKADDSGLIACIAEEKKTFTSEVVVSLSKENGSWKMHLDDDFINALLGNMNGEDYPPEIEKQIDELSREYEKKLDAWEEGMEETFYESPSLIR